MLSHSVCLTLCDPMDCNLPGSSVHGIFQARILKGVANPPPVDLPDPGIKPRSPALHMDSLSSEPAGKPLGAIAKRKKRYSFRFGNYLEGRAAVHGVAKSWTLLSDFTFTFHFHALEKDMATHSSVLAWRIPGTGEPGGLPSGVAQSRTGLKRLISSRRRKRK